MKNSKSKLLKKRNYTPAAVAAAPTKKVEMPKGNTTTRQERKSNTEIAKERSRARRMRSIMKLGMKKELIEEMFAQENNRMILVLLNGKYTIENGTQKKKVTKRGKDHKVISTEEVDVPIILRGIDAAKKYAENEKLHIMTSGSNAIWILSDKDNVDAAVEKLQILGRVSVTKPATHTGQTVKPEKKQKKKKKPTNNTSAAKTAAKVNRKNANKEGAEMRPYYAALRKGGVSKRIQKHNPKLAEKIKAWLKERECHKDSLEYRRTHRQMSSTEIKANKNARKAAKHLAAIERRREREKKAMANNQAALEKRAQKAAKSGKKAVQQTIQPKEELKQAA